MRVYKEKVLAAGDASGNLSSSSFQLESSFGASASCIVSAGTDPAGTLTILGSVDNINFTPLQNAGVNVTLTVSGNGTYIFDVTQTSVAFLRVDYTAASGTGTLNITIYAKGF